MNRGEANPRAKLTWEAVCWLRENEDRYAGPAILAWEVYVRFGRRVTRSTVHAVLVGETWKTNQPEEER